VAAVVLEDGGRRREQRGRSTAGAERESGGTEARDTAEREGGWVGGEESGWDADDSGFPENARGEAGNRKMQMSLRQLLEPLQ
jgi:hypothetical protein